jgi:hypothetical protein
MTDETPIQPIFAYPRLGPAFVMKDLCAVLVETGVPYPAAHARIKSYTKDRLIHVRKAAVNTRPNEYEFSELGAAVILSALQDLGIQDRDLLQAASEGIYAWSPYAEGRDRKYIEEGSEYLPRHPIDRAIVGTGHKGEHWFFYLDVHRDAQSGERLLNCDLARLGDPMIGTKNIPPSAYPVASVAIPLHMMMQTVLRRLAKGMSN